MLQRRSGRALLQELSPQEWLEWQVFLESEPQLLKRIGWLFASLRQTMVELKRDTKKRPTPYKMSDFMLSFGDEIGPGTPTRGRQSWQEQKAALFGYAREFAASRGKR